MVPIGTKVRVVNQPFVFGWQEGQLYMQPFDVLEDDTRDWKKAPKKLISQSVAATVQKQLKAQNEQINWDVVTAVSHAPRGVPVPVSAADASIDQVLAKAPLVLNQVPDGSTWDGKTDLPMDEGTFRQMLSEIDPNAPASAGGSAASGGGGAAPSTSSGAAPRSTTHVNTSAQASKTGS